MDCKPFLSSIRVDISVFQHPPQFVQLWVEKVEHYHIVIL